MAGIQLIQRKNQQKTSSYRRNIVLYKEIGIKDGRINFKLGEKIHREVRIT